MPPKLSKGNVRLMTDEGTSTGSALRRLKCRACSGYGNCGYKQMNIYSSKAVSICQMRKEEKLQCERDGVPLRCNLTDGSRDKRGPSALMA